MRKHSDKNGVVRTYTDAEYEAQVGPIHRPEDEAEKVRAEKAKKVKRSKLRMTENSINNADTLEKLQLVCADMFKLLLNLVEQKPIEEDEL